MPLTDTGETGSTGGFPAALVGKFLLQAKDHALILLDPQGRVVAWLAGAERLLGFTPAEMQGRPLSEIFTREDRSKGLDTTELEVARNSGNSEDDRWHLRKDGSRIWVTGTLDALHDDSGALVGFAKLMRDRTDMRTKLDVLEGRVQRLQAAHQRTERFLATLGHELRNPLSPIASAVKVIGNLNEPGAATAVQVIERQMAVLQRLADDLVDLQRLDHGKLELRRQEVDLSQLLRDAIAGQMDEARRKGLRMEALLPPAPLVLEGDPARLLQVVNNLLSNAIKYTQRGGTIWIQATEEGPETVVRFEDDGMGIDADLLPRIFELFTQDVAAEKVAPGGLGIGLALVRELVELHGGTVAARSGGQGKGSEFTLRLPRGSVS